MPPQIWLSPPSPKRTGFGASVGQSLLKTLFSLVRASAQQWLNSLNIPLQRTHDSKTKLNLQLRNKTEVTTQRRNFKTNQVQIKTCDIVLFALTHFSLDDHGPVATEPRRPWKQMQFTQSAHFPSQTGSAVRPRLDCPAQQLSRPSPGFSDSSCTFLVCFLSVSLTGVLDP